MPFTKMGDWDRSRLRREHVRNRGENKTPVTYSWRKAAGSWPRDSQLQGRVRIKDASFRAFSFYKELKSMMLNGIT